MCTSDWPNGVDCMVFFLDMLMYEEMGGELSIFFSRCRSAFGWSIALFLLMDHVFFCLVFIFFFSLFELIIMSECDSFECVSVGRVGMYLYDPLLLLT